MPALAAIRERIIADPEWQDGFERILSACQSFSQKLSIIHVTRGVLVSILLSETPELIPSNASSSNGTLNAERALGLMPSVYLYGGRGYPMLGGAGVAFGPDIESQRTGDATPFDTGGLFGAKIHLILPPSRDPQSARREFVQASSCPLETWREECATFVAAYFATIPAYWTDRPIRPDPEAIFQHAMNEWRAWTWEVRIRESIPLLECLFWCAAEEQMIAYIEALESASTSEASFLIAFLNRTLKADGSPVYRQLLEERARIDAGIH